VTQAVSTSRILSDEADAHVHGIELRLGVLHPTLNVAQIHVEFEGKDGII